MDKVLVFSMAGHEFQEACQYEAALEQRKLGKKVYFMYCDGYLGICGDNRKCSALKCKICSARFKGRINKYLSNDISLIPLSDYLTDDIKREVSNIKFESMVCTI